MVGADGDPCDAILRHMRRRVIAVRRLKRSQLSPYIAVVDA
jgi:hypothetical protein